MKHKYRLWATFFFSLIFLTLSGFTVVGHRGDPSKYPEETIQSDNSAFNSGADYVELDLRLSKDGTLVISHDDDLFRVTHTHAIVTQNNWQALKQLRYDNGEHLKSLDQLFSYYRKKPHTKFILETKIDHSVDHSYALEDKITACIKKYHMEKRIMIHSFSAASLFHLRELIPKAYLIFIVGSLKRINFSNLPQVNAINVAQDVIQEHPWLIHWLHSLNKQIYVWTEMDETPSLWHWLINKNIDGVVTNFPATGFKYKMAKENTKKYDIHRQGIYFGKNKTSIMMNPYIRIKQKKFIYPGQKLNIMYGVRINQRLYYQIAERSFISAEFVNLDLKEKDISAYKNKKILAKPNKTVPLYSYPDNQAKTKNTLPPNKIFKIINFNGSPKNMWLYTKLGWVKAKDTLFYGIFTSQDFKKYRSLSTMSRYNNIALLTFQPDVAPSQPYFSIIKQTKKLLTKFTDKKRHKFSQTKINAF